MGPELALAATLAGTGASLLGQRQQQKDRRRIINRSMERTSETQDRANALIQEEGRKFTPEQRMQDMQAQEQQTYDQQQKDLGAGAGIIETAGDTGNVSADFLKAKADKALSEGNRLTAVAREIARARAPGQQLNAEGIRRAGVMGDVGSRWSTARNLADAAQNQAAAVEEPWWGQLGKVAQTVGGAYLGPLGAGTSAGAGATNAALAESAAGLTGYGVSSATPWWASTIARPRIRFGVA